MSKDKKFICSNLITKGIRVIHGSLQLSNYFCLITNMNLNNVECGICNHFNLSEIKKPEEAEKNEKIK